MTDDLAANITEIERTLRILAEPHGVVELRVPRSQRGTISGYFDDLRALAEAAGGLSGQAPGIYITLNPIPDTLLARAKNRTIPFAKHATSDADVLSRRWLPLDFDPVRPAGISSTNSEHKAALERTRHCREYLRERGWPDPIVASSGNGAHLLYSIALKNIEEAGDVVKGCLEALALLFSDSEVELDLGTYNAARIWKLYGTLAAKGDFTTDRPHRLARILAVPSTLKPVAADLLTNLAKARPAPSVARQDCPTSFDLDSWLAQNGLAVATRGPWKDGRKWILATCPWDPGHQNRSAYIVQLPNGRIAAGCLHASCANKNWRDLTKLYKPEDQAASASHYRGPNSAAREEICYLATSEGLVWHKPGRDGFVSILLTNFTARIVADVVEDDGVEQYRRYEIEGSLEGRALRFVIPASQFASLNWVAERLGPKAVIFPGFSLRDNARAAIQLLSGEITERRVYTHIGWREIGGAWAYLHAGGALGTGGSMPEIEVSLGGHGAQLEGFALPQASLDLANAARASLNILDLAPDRVTFPLFATIWRAVLGGVDFSVHLCGPTGVFKTELAAIAQQFFGASLDARHLPGSWSSTENSLEALAFTLKDAICVIDDFAPAGSLRDQATYHRKADRVFRAQGNQAGRQRMRADSTLREPKPPRGLILSTGEEIPRGQSLRARMLIQDIGPGQISSNKLSSCQEDARSGLFSGLMARFLQWLAGRYDSVQRGLRKEIRQLRSMVVSSSQHRRNPEIIANLMIGLAYFLEFAREAGVISGSEVTKLLERASTAFDELCKSQGEHQRTEEPVERFLRLLAGAIFSGAAHLNDARTGNLAEGSGGPCIGWIEDTYLLLQPDAAFAAAQRMGRDQGEPLTLGQRTLWKRMSEKGLIERHEKGRHTIPWSICGSRQRSVICLTLTSLNVSSSEIGTIGICGTDAASGANCQDFGAWFGSRFLDQYGKIGISDEAGPRGTETTYTDNPDNPDNPDSGLANPSAGLVAPAPPTAALRTHPPEAALKALATVDGTNGDDRSKTEGSPCRICGVNAWWSRPGGGELVCGNCHPNPFAS